MAGGNGYGNGCGLGNGYGYGYGNGNGYGNGFGFGLGIGIGRGCGCWNPNQIRYHTSVSYQVLARSWRPQRFADLLGQDAVVQTLQNALSTDALGHAYLFSGLRGVGKTTAARLLAKAVNCVDGPTAEPCGECVSCREITDGASIDVVEIDGASNRKIDDVRDLREMLRFHPTRDRFRVIIIDEVHMLTPEAFNALLKSIEEPPPYIIFVLATTERHKLPATILSRCQQLEFRPLAGEAIRAHLRTIAEREGFELSPGAAATVAAAAQGSVRDALSLIDQLRAFAAGAIDDDAVAAVLGVPSFEVTADLVGALADGRVADALAGLRAELAAGHDATVLFQEVGRMLRSLVHIAVDADLGATMTDDHRRRLEPLAAALGVDALTRMLGLWLEQEPLLREVENRELALEVASLRLARWPAVRRLESWLAGGDVPPTGAGPGAPVTGTSGTGPPPVGAAPATISELLWSEHPRLAAAVDAAQVGADAGVVTLCFGADAEAPARYAGSASCQPVLQQACCRLFGDVAEVRIEIEAAGAERTTGTAELEAMIDDDPGVRLVREIIGGEIVSVRPDGGA